MPRFVPPTFRVLRPANFDGCLKLLEKLQAENWIFRGQRRATWGLEPKLEREARKDRVRPIAKERETLRTFQAEFAPHPSGSAHFDITQILALIQHYHSCTRLLDFTDDHRIGIFFAIREAKNILVLRDEFVSDEMKSLLAEYREHPSALWCINEKAIIKHCNIVIKQVLLSRSSGSEAKKEAYTDILDGKCNVGFSQGRPLDASYWYQTAMSQLLARAVLGDHQMLEDRRYNDLSTFDIAPLIMSVRLPLLPKFNQRIVNQKGLFLAPFNMVKNSLPRSEGKVTLFESNLCATLAISADALAQTEVETICEQMPLEQTQVIKIILPPDILKNLIEYTHDLSEHSLGLRI